MKYSKKLLKDGHAKEKNGIKNNCQQLKKKKILFKV